MDTVRRKERRASVRRKEFKGSAVVEMSYIIPLFLGLFVLLVHAVFYYHDKAVLTGAAQAAAMPVACCLKQSMTWKPSSGNG